MSTYQARLRFGTELVPGGGVRFRFYAPAAERIDVWIEDREPVGLRSRGGGWFEAAVPAAHAGTHYRFTVDGAEQRVPDPASRFQPEGVLGPSEVIDPAAYDWPSDGYVAPTWAEHVFYELNVGTFTPEGTFAAAAARLPDLAALGITAIELMPLAEFVGERNWGYDGVLPYAPSRAYGTPRDLKDLVVAAHALGLAIYLDVVYNHFGPEGNFIGSYAPTFYTEAHHTPWGAAIAVEAQGRDDERAYFIENACYWTREYRFDGLRLDAVHAIYDGDDRHFLRELAATVAERSDRPVHLVLENARNEATLLEAGYAAQWDDDAHQVLHVLVTGESDGYYEDYVEDPIARLGRVLTEGFAYQGEHSKHEAGPRGEPSAHLPLASFVAFLQNHDQVGNRAFGDRITDDASPAAVRAAVAIVLLAPWTPLLFMGEEWAATTPFQYFCDYEGELADAVREGRRKEFAAFANFSSEADRARVPDPNAAGTHANSTLDWSERTVEPHATWLTYYRDLLAIRRAEIVPHARTVRGTQARFATFGDRGLRATWMLADGTSLVLETNLGDLPCAALVAVHGRTIFSTQPSLATGEPLGPWAVRWTRS